MVPASCTNPGGGGGCLGWQVSSQTFWPVRRSLLDLGLNFIGPSSWVKEAEAFTVAWQDQYMYRQTLPQKMSKITAAGEEKVAARQAEAANQGGGSGQLQAHHIHIFFRR